MVLAGISNVLARQKERSAFLGRVDHSQSVESPVVTWNASWTHVAETLGQLHPLRVLASLLAQDRLRYERLPMQQ
jgi:hypothetical protein